MNRLLIRNLREVLPFSFFLSAVLLNFPLIHSLASEAPSDLVYQGRIFKPDSSALEASNVVFDVSVYSPDGSCLLYEESHSVNMAGSGGSFSLALGMGTPVGPAYSVKEVFSNIGSFTGGGSCSYTPVSGHSRIIRVTFDDGGGAIALQDQLIQSVPYALYASKLEGKGKSDFLQINTTTSALSQANANSLFQSATYSELIALAGGTSNVFAKSADLPVASGVLNLSGAGQGVRVLDTPVGADHAVNKNYTDGKLGGKSIDAANFAGLANGESLKWDTSANTGLGGWVRYTALSGSGYVANGGQAGAVSLGPSNSNALTLQTAGNPRMTIDSSGNIGIGTTLPTMPVHIYSNLGYGSGAKALTLTNTLTPYTSAGAGGMLVDWDGGGGIYMSDSTAGLHGKYEIYGGRLGIGTMSNTPIAFSTNDSERVFIDSSGNVGIGNTSPSSKLEVTGSIISTPGNIASGASVDLATSNTITLAAVGGSTINLSNMVHGGTYTLVIKDTTPRTYTFSGCNTSKFKPASGSTLNGTWSVFTILALYNGSTYDCVITWATGYQ